MSNENVKGVIICTTAPESATHYRVFNGTVEFFKSGEDNERKIKWCKYSHKAKKWRWLGTEKPPLIKRIT